MSGEIKCKYCTWSVPKWITRNGRRVNGLHALYRHMDATHIRQLMDLQDRCEKETELDMRDALAIAGEDLET